MKQSLKRRLPIQNKLIKGYFPATLSAPEPITGIIVGLIVFNEPITIRTAIGALPVVDASILIAILDMKKAAGHTTNIDIE